MSDPVTKKLSYTLKMALAEKNLPMKQMHIYEMMAAMWGYLTWASYTQSDKMATKLLNNTALMNQRAIELGYTPEHVVAFKAAYETFLETYHG